MAIRGGYRAGRHRCPPCPSQVPLATCKASAAAGAAALAHDEHAIPPTCSRRPQRLRRNVSFEERGHVLGVVGAVLAAHDRRCHRGSAPQSAYPVVGACPVGREFGTGLDRLDVACRAGSRAPCALSGPAPELVWQLASERQRPMPKGSGSLPGTSLRYLSSWLPDRTECCSTHAPGR